MANYRVSRSGGGFSPLLLSASVLEFVDDSVDVNALYKYTVHAIDGAGNVSDPMSISITTRSSPTNENECLAFDSDLLSRYSFDLSDSNDPFASGVLIDSVGSQNGTSSGASAVDGEIFDSDFEFGSQADLSNSSFDDSDIEEIQCLMPNGIAVDVLIHPDDEIVHIKQLVLNRATTDGKW